MIQELWPILTRITSRTVLTVSLLNGIAATAQAAFLTVNPYLSFNDSPFNGENFSYFYLEDFEDGLLNTPGVTATSVIVTTPGSTTDSVDADDGVIDGSGNNGRSLYSTGNESLDFSFSPSVLGSLPTHVGIVWTDVGLSSDPLGTGFGQVTFEAFDPFGVSLGVFGPTSVGDGLFTGETAEDTFFGVVDAGGISRITISMNSTDWEVDHLQYGRIVSTAAVPEPLSTFGVLLCGGLGIFLRQKRAQ